MEIEILAVVLEYGIDGQPIRYRVNGKVHEKDGDYGYTCFLPLACLDSLASDGERQQHLARCLLDAHETATREPEPVKQPLAGTVKL